MAAVNLEQNPSRLGMRPDKQRDRRQGVASHLLCAEDHDQRSENDRSSCSRTADISCRKGWSIIISISDILGIEGQSGQALSER